MLQTSVLFSSEINKISKYKFIELNDEEIPVRWIELYPRHISIYIISSSYTVNILYLQLHYIEMNMVYVLQLSKLVAMINLISKNKKLTAKHKNKGLLADI